MRYRNSKRKITKYLYFIHNHEAIRFGCSRGSVVKREHYDPIIKKFITYDSSVRLIRSQSVLSFNVTRDEFYCYIEHQLFHMCHPN